MWNISLSVQFDISRVSAAHSFVRYKVENEKRYSISTSNHVLFCLLHVHRHADNEGLTIFRTFPTTSGRLPKILQKLSESHTNVSEKGPKIAEDFQGRSGDVSIIHQVRFKSQT